MVNEGNALGGSHWVKDPISAKVLLLHLESEALEVRRVNAIMSLLDVKVRSVNRISVTCLFLPTVKQK